MYRTQTSNKKTTEQTFIMKTFKFFNFESKS